MKPGNVRIRLIYPLATPNQRQVQIDGTALDGATGPHMGTDFNVDKEFNNFIILHNYKNSNSAY